MARPLRLEYPGAVYHLTSRGNARQDIFLDATDRRIFLELLAEQVRQHGWKCYAYCLMDNHYHLLIETPEANLSRGMQSLNGRYTQRFNRRHQRVGHVFQGRYKSILIEKESYLLEVSRYIVLNPVRAGMVTEAGAWMWSSYPDTAGERVHPDWLSVGELLNHFVTDTKRARNRYRKFVQDGVAAESPWSNLRGQVYLGNKMFIDRVQAMIDRMQPDRDIPTTQCHPARPDYSHVLEEVRRVYQLEDNAAALDRKNKEAFRVSVFLLRRACNMRLKEVAAKAGISAARVSQIERMMREGKISERYGKLRKKYNIKA